MLHSVHKILAKKYIVAPDQNSDFYRDELNLLLKNIFFSHRSPALNQLWIMASIENPAKAPNGELLATF